MEKKTNFWIWLKHTMLCCDVYLSSKNKKVEKIQSPPTRNGNTYQLNDGRHIGDWTSEELTENGGKNARGKWWAEQNTGKFTTRNIKCSTWHGPIDVADQFPRKWVATLRPHPRNDYGVFPMDEIQLLGGNICDGSRTRKIENDAKSFGGEIGNDLQAETVDSKRCADAFEFIFRKLTNK